MNLKNTASKLALAVLVVALATLVIIFTLMEAGKSDESLFHPNKLVKFSPFGENDNKPLNILPESQNSTIDIVINPFYDFSLAYERFPNFIKNYTNGTLKVIIDTDPSKQVTLRDDDDVRYAGYSVEYYEESNSTNIQIYLDQHHPIFNDDRQLSETVHDIFYQALSFGEHFENYSYEEIIRIGNDTYDEARLNQSHYPFLLQRK